MKKILTATALMAGLLGSASVLAADIEVTLSDGYHAVGSLTDKINLARSGRFTAQENRAGFVKNSFDFTVSANVVAGVNEDSANSRFGVVSGSNKGYVVFTGSSIGGSIAQCGDPIAKTETNLAGGKVEEGALNFDNANACGL